jgi:hypothetical protein
MGGHQDLSQRPHIQRGFDAMLVNHKLEHLKLLGSGLVCTLGKSLICVRAHVSFSFNSFKVCHGVQT